MYIENIFILFSFLNLQNTKINTMKKSFLIALILSISITSYSQISFEKGYYIDNSGQKTDCLIKNYDWNKNPKEIEVKISENSESSKISITSLTEFGIYDFSKYIRETVNIDRSSNNVNDVLFNDKNPIFNEETLLLKVIIEGDASLYQYKDGNLITFFYSLNNSKIEPLIYKTYLKSENVLGTNEQYKQQLWSDLKCENITSNEVSNIEYSESKLANLFVKYNKCKNASFTNFDEFKQKKVFNINLISGLDYSSLKIENSSDYLYNYNLDFGNKINFRIGGELELILPFNKNKWTVFITPSYQRFKADGDINENTVYHNNFKVNYQVLELPLGIRHYFFLNKNSKIFTDTSFSFNFPINSTIEYKSDYIASPTVIDINYQTNLGFGLGYTYKKYRIGAKYYLNNDILYNYDYWSSTYKKLSFTLGYTIY